MESLTLQEAFARFGGSPSNRLRSVSAIASDGSGMILACSSGRFRHPERGVLRYEDHLSREAGPAAERRSLGEHLTQARDGNLPIRMVVLTPRLETAGKIGQDIHVRADLVGKLLVFDGDLFIVDFIRTEPPNAVVRQRPRAC